MPRIGCVTLLIPLLLLVAISCPADAGSTVIKIATVTPEGSTWTNILHQFAVEAQKQTNGEVQFKIYAGGVSGGEMDVLRKMRVNRIHAAGFSGVGLGVLLPEIRILEAPLLFRNYGEVDHVKDKLFTEFSAGFEKKGYVLLGFVEAGFVYFFSEPNPSGVDALASVKMWAWKGDPVAQTFLETFGIRTYPLHVTDVNTGLETGMINAFYSPPLAAVAFQWYSRIRYMLDFPMVNSTGALLMTKRAFYRLSKRNQEIIRNLAGRYSKELVQLSRRDNDEALEILKASGIQLVAPTERQITTFKENARKTYEKNIPKLYSRDLFNRVQRILKAYRAGK